MPNVTSLVLRFTAGLVVLCAAGVGGVGYTTWQYIKSVEKTLPNVEKLTKHVSVEPSEVYSRDGRKIGEIFTERRYPTEYNAINPLLIDAFVAAEDMRFFEHHGVDYNGLGRAALRFISKSSGPIQGGSTITQQLAKNLLLTREKTLERKIKDILLAMRIEDVLSKEKILELYLNTLFLGNNSYGVEAAARNYFRKTNKELNLAESSLIAGLAPAPSAYSPVDNQQKAKVRQKFVLDQMVKSGKITQEQATKAHAQALKIYRAESPNAKAAPYFFAEVKKQLETLIGENKLSSEGYKVYTTVDLDLQHETQHVIQESLKQYENKRSFRGATKHIGPTFEPALKELVSQPQNDDAIMSAIVVEIFPTIGALGVVSSKGIGLLLVEDHQWALGEARQQSTRSDTKTEATTKEGTNDVVIGKKIAEDFANTLKPGDIVHIRTLDRKTPKRVATNIKQIQGLSKYLSFFPSGSSKNEIKYYQLTDSDGVEASALVANGDTGEILAIVGGHDFAETQFNRASQAKRQVGSSVKPLYYSLAMDNGFSPASLLDSPPIVIGDWRPENYSKEFTGRATLRKSLIQSYNIHSIQLSQALGLKKCAQHFSKLGLDWDVKQGGLSLALGSGSATLLQMTQAYTPFANGGHIQPLHYIAKIVDRKGNTIFSWTKDSAKLAAAPIKHSEYREESKTKSNANPRNAANIAMSENVANDENRILSPAATFVIDNVLQDAIKFGTGTAAQGVSPNAAGKTGTTNNYTDAWFLGVLPGFVGGVWLGFDDATKTLGTNTTGGKVAAPLWRSIMKKVADTYPQKNWTEPEGIRWIRVDPTTSKPSNNGLLLPVVAGTEPGAPDARNALGVLGTDSNGNSVGGKLEENDTSALRGSY